MTNYLTNEQYKDAKFALTQAKKKGPHAVIQEVTFRLQWWDDGDYSYPDAWQDWIRAAEDAKVTLRYQR